MDEAAEQQLVDGLKQKHGVSQVHQFAAPDGETIFVRVPPNAIWRRFRGEMQDEKRREAAGERLLRACLLYPDQAGLTALLEGRPGLLDAFASELVELAGLAKTIEKKVF